MTIKYGTARVLVKIKKQVSSQESMEKIGALINSIFCKGDWIEYHKSHKRKGYVFSPLILIKDGSKSHMQETNHVGDTCEFIVYSNNYDLLPLIETKISDNDSFEVLDVTLDTVEWNSPVKRLVVKTPIMMREYGKLMVISKNSSEEEKQEYLDVLNKKIKQDFEYINEQELPDGYTFVKDIVDYRAKSIPYNGVKLVGTRCKLVVENDILSRIVTNHIVTHGIGEKSSLLGAGSVILKEY